MDSTKHYKLNFNFRETRLLKINFIKKNLEKIIAEFIKKQEETQSIKNMIMFSFGNQETGKFEEKIPGYVVYGENKENGEVAPIMSLTKSFKENVPVLFDKLVKLELFDSKLETTKTLWEHPLFHTKNTKKVKNENSQTTLQRCK